MIDFDTSDLARCDLPDPGWQPVQQLAATDCVACCLHGTVELLAALHRKLREGQLTATGGVALLEVKTYVMSCHCLTVFGQAVLFGMRPLLTRILLVRGLRSSGTSNVVIHLTKWWERPAEWLRPGVVSRPQQRRCSSQNLSAAKTPTTAT